VLKLESLQLQYYSSLNFFYSHLKFSKSTHSERILNHKLRSNSTKIDVIEKLSIRVYIYVVKQAAKVLGERPNTKVLS
jgi:vacuolar protein sorting-associated protein 13A/C